MKAHVPEQQLGDAENTPRFRLLSDEKVRRIHEASLWVLEEVGVRIATEEARKLLVDAGCKVTEGDILTVPRRVVEEAIESAPKRIVIYDRDGNEAMFLEGNNTYFGIGATCLKFLDPETGERRDARLEDIALACTVADALPNLDFVTTPMVTKATQDVPQRAVNASEFEAMVSNTTKPLVVLMADARSLGDLLDMAEVVAGSPQALRERPFVVPFFSGVSPLFFNAETLDKLLTALDRGIPVRIGSAPMAGAAGPVTLAGTVASSVAELLAGLVISQAHRPGASVIVGSTPMIMDMRTTNIAVGPEGSALTIAVVEMAHHYGLPFLGGVGLPNSVDADQQTALEQTMAIYSCILAGTHVMPYIGGLEAGLIFSLEAAVMGDEIIGMVRRIMRGIPVDDESLALDTIRSVGPGGNFLETEHTFRHYKREQWQPTLLCRTTYDSWVEKGSKLMGDRVKERLADIVRGHRPKPLPEQVEAGLSRVIDRRLQGLT